MNVLTKHTSLDCQSLATDLKPAVRAQCYQLRTMHHALLWPRSICSVGTIKVHSLHQTTPQIQTADGRSYRTDTIGREAIK